MKPPYNLSVTRIDAHHYEVALFRIGSTERMGYFAGQRAGARKVLRALRDQLPATVTGPGAQELLEKRSNT